MNAPIIIVPFLNVGGMALWPVILVGDKQSATDIILINHERIHLRQQAELLVVPFYILYLLNYLINLMVYRQHNKAYLNIVFEREAYALETDINYLQRRKWCSWINFF